MKQIRSWILILLASAIAVLAACASGGVSVGYSPVSACGSLDYDPVECNR